MAESELARLVDQVEIRVYCDTVPMRALVLTMIAIMAFASACGDSATSPSGLEPPSTFLLVVSPVRAPDEKAEVELERIDGIAVLAIRAPEGPIDLHVENRGDRRLAVTNETGEEVLVSLFRDGSLVTEVPLPQRDTWYYGDSG